MTVKRAEGGGYVVDVRPAGRNGRRFVRRFKTRREAKEFEAKILLQYGEVPGRFERDDRRLSDLVRLWYKVHGITLKDSQYRYSRTLAICERLGDPPVSKFTAVDFGNYRIGRLKEVSVATVNHETRYLRAVFSELSRLGYYHGDNPLSAIRVFPEAERELAFLTHEQIRALVVACEKSKNSHCLPVVRLCLATGARWSEANGLTARCLLENRVIFQDTKNGKSRVVPISEKLARYLRSVAFPVSAGRLFDDAQGAFRSAISRAGIVLPKGQLTHVLRHTFASHFMMNGGSILVLQRVLGHSDLKVTMRYAHFAPDYMEQVVSLCPLDVENLW